MLEQLENSLNEIFVKNKNAPRLPSDGKKALVEYLPWLSLFLGLLALYTVYALWHWAHQANGLLGYAGNVGAPHLTFGIWLGLAVLAIEALLYIAAFPGTRDRKKSGWNLVFYALLVNAAYGIIMLFTSYGGFGNLVFMIAGSVIGLYLLFQIRSSYGGKAATSKRG